MTKTELAIKLAIIIALCAGLGTCEKWQYNECKAVGHATSYCVAQRAGCVGK